MENKINDKLHMIDIFILFINYVIHI